MATCQTNTLSNSDKPANKQDKNAKTKHKPWKKGRRNNRHGPKPKLTKEERRLKYTAVARERKQKLLERVKARTTTCYHCRQRGHTMATCPLITNKNISGARHKEQVEKRICYKCGSTEHALSNCPNRGKDGDTSLPFALCFVCGGKGHLASQCPDNTKGIYVNGGCCKFCGSTRHLASHCPEKKKKKSSNDASNGKKELYEELLLGDRDDNPEAVTITTGLRAHDYDEVMRSDKKDKKNTTIKKRRVVKF